MKRLQDKLSAKLIALLILTACVIGIPYLGCQAMYYMYQCRNITQFSDFWEYSYPESIEFSEDVNLRLTQFTNYLKLKEILETNGELDYNKVAARVYGSNGMEEYTVSDLIKYNVMNYGFYPEDVMQEASEDAAGVKRTLNSKKRMVYPILIAEDGKAVVGGELKQNTFVANFTKEENQVFADLEEACRYYQALWDQQAAEGEAENNTNPSGTNPSERNRSEIAEFLESISDKLQKESSTGDTKALTWASSSQEVNVNLLSDVAYCMTFYVSFYQEYKNIFENETFSEQDFLYWISVGNRQIVTNMQDHLPEEEISGKKTYHYPCMGEIWYQTENHMMDATMQADRGIIAELEELFLEQSGGNVSIYIVIPGDHAGLFDRQEKNLEYSYHSIPQYFGWLVGLGILGILSICFLFYTAGHRAGYEGIYLNWFDRWYTEIAAGICIGLGGLLLVLLLECAPIWGGVWNEFYRVFFPFTDRNIIFLLLSVGLYLMTLISFSSLTRRIKARTIWRNSLTCRILRYLRRRGEDMIAALMQMWENRSISKKIVIVYLAMLLGNYVIVIAFLPFLEAVDYGELGVAGFCFGIMMAVFVADFKILQWLIQQKAELVEICKGTERISSGEWKYKLEETKFHGILQDMAGAVNRMGDGLSRAIEQSIRDERMKTDLITNVSHDIKTPLTSIINYVDLLKREQFEDEKVQSYLEVLDQKSQRLKHLIDDLIEASKLSSNTVILSIEKIDLVELVRQTNGEFAEKFANKNLTMIPSLPEKSVLIEADGKGMWRVLENLYINVSKYAMEHTRVYISVSEKMGSVEFSIKNISESPLNIDASELTERFIRGDLSRSTEGSGLGLSIAKSLTELMHGTFEVYLDGDLFRVTLGFGVWRQEGEGNNESEIAIGN